MLGSSLLGQILKKYLPEQIQNAVVKIFLDDNNLHPTHNRILKEAQELAQNEVVRSVRTYLEDSIGPIDLKTVEHIYGLIFDEQEKIRIGIQYTPAWIVDYIIENTVKHDAFVCDPSCGSGGFLFSAAKKIAGTTGRPIVDVIESRVYGCDISSLAIQRAKLVLSLLAVQRGSDTREIKFNLICSDSLMIDWAKQFPEVFARGGFDAVVGNPPYVKIQNMRQASRKAIRDRWTVTEGSHNLYIPFIQLGSKLINANGIMGYIVSSMYFRSIASEKLRAYLQENRLISKIIDFGDTQIFEGRQTYTCITFIDKKPKESLDYALVEDIGKLSNLEFTKIDYCQLKPKKWRLLCKTDHDNIQKIESIGMKLGVLADIDTGIATLKDVLYFVDGGNSSDGYFLKTFNEQTYRIEKQITREIVKVSDFRTEDELKRNTRRIIFPYISVRPPKLMAERILAKNFPKAYEYLCAVKEELGKRDKGSRPYENWYAYGRTQGLNKTGEKMLTPTFSDRPRFMMLRKKDALFCNGYSVMLPDAKQSAIDVSSFKKQHMTFDLLGRILNSRVMDYYIRKTSYVIEGGYYCYQKQFIETFSIPEFSENEISQILREDDQRRIDELLVRKYDLTF